jgi:hypothetical protein
MMPQETVIEIAGALLAKTKADQIEWDATPQGRGYFVDFPSSRISIFFRRPETESDYYEFVIANNAGIEVGSLAAALNPAHPQLELLENLYSEAERRVTQWDKIVAEIKQRLETGPEPRQPEPRRHARPRSSPSLPPEFEPPPPEQEIPF